MTKLSLISVPNRKIAIGRKHLTDSWRRDKSAMENTIHLSKIRFCETINSNNSKRIDLLNDVATCTSIRRFKQNDSKCRYGNISIPSRNKNKRLVVTYNIMNFVW